MENTLDDQSFYSLEWGLLREIELVIGRVAEAHLSTERQRGKDRAWKATQ